MPRLKTWMAGMNAVTTRTSFDALRFRSEPSMLHRFRRFLRAPEAKASRTARLIALEHPGRARWTPRETVPLTKQGYLGNAVVHGAVRLLAGSAASVTFLVYDEAGVHDRHPLLDLLARPNPRQDGTAFLEALFTHLLIAGNAYVEAVSVDGTVRELYALRPDRMRVVPGADGWPESYEYVVGGRTVRFDQRLSPTPILHLGFFHPLDDHYGFAPLEAAAAALDTHNAAAAWNKALLDNAARPSGALVYAGPDGAILSEAQFERLRAELETTYQGAANAGRPLLLEGGLDWKPMALTPKDMDFLEAKHAAAREIALAFAIPPMLLGIPGDNTYANYQEANRVFWRQAVLPLALRFAAAFGHWLTPAFGALRLDVDTDRIEALAADRAALWQRVAAAPFLTVNEKREAVGYAPLADSDAPT
jgi:HK97 family phage portal protein